MRIQCLARAVAALSFLWLPLGSAAQTGVQDFGLIDTHAGWALAGDHLFWSTSLGAHWTDITPAGGGALSGVYFRGDGNGWAVEFAAGALSVAHTPDSGNHWTTQTIASPFTNALVSSDRASTYFTDSLHGFMMLGVQSSSAFRRGILLRTVDGGASWTQAPAPPVGGEFN